MDSLARLIEKASAEWDLIYTKKQAASKKKVPNTNPKVRPKASLVKSTYLPPKLKPVKAKIPNQKASLKNFSKKTPPKSRTEK